MCHHPRCWVGELAGGSLITAQECAGHWAVRESCSVYLLVLICIIVVTVRFLHCSVKLSLSWPTNFAFFFRFSSLLRRGEGWQSNRVVLCCWLGPNHDTGKSKQHLIWHKASWYVRNPSSFFEPTSINRWNLYWVSALQHIVVVGFHSVLKFWS